MIRKRRAIKKITTGMVDTARRVWLSRYKHERAEFMLDMYYFHISRPITKTEFIAACAGVFKCSGFYGPIISLISKDLRESFDQLVSCGALKYIPRKHILPGENE